MDCLRAGADFAKGSRFVDGGGSADIMRLRRVDNRAWSPPSSSSTEPRYSDPFYGDSIFLSIACCTFRDVPGFENLINLRVAKAGLRIAEVPSFEAKRLNGHSHQIPDGTASV